MPIPVQLLGSAFGFEYSLVEAITRVCDPWSSLRASRLEASAIMMRRTGGACLCSNFKFINGLKAYILGHVQLSCYTSHFNQAFAIQYPTSRRPKSTDEPSVQHQCWCHCLSILT